MASKALTGRRSHSQPATHPQRTLADWIKHFSSRGHDVGLAIASAQTVMAVLDEDRAAQDAKAKAVFEATHAIQQARWADREAGKAELRAEFVAELRKLPRVRKLESIYRLFGM